MIRPIIDKAFQFIDTVSTTSLATVPNYGKISAALFVFGLGYETHSRYLPSKPFKKADPNLVAQHYVLVKNYVLVNFKEIFQSKVIQVAAFFYGTSLDPIFKVVAVVGQLFVPRKVDPIVEMSVVIPLEGNEQRDWEIKKKKAHCLSDRPLLKDQLAVGYDVVNIASKIIQSFATGVVAQKMWNNSTSGKVRAVVTTALLALSAWNVYNVQLQDTKCHADA